MWFTNQQDEHHLGTTEMQTLSSYPRRKSITPCSWQKKRLSLQSALTSWFSSHGLKESQEETFQIKPSSPFGLLPYASSRNPPETVYPLPIAMIIKHNKNKCYLLIQVDESLRHIALMLSQAVALQRCVNLFSFPPRSPPL